MLGIVAIVTLLACVQALPTDVDVANVSPSRFDTFRRIARDGYYSENHYVTTTDGYILEINRIPFSRFQNTSSGPRPVVFLMHGLQSSALAYITLGPRYAIAYVLADAGYDVWIGNARGVMNSRRHVTLDPDNPKDRLEFFDYTYEDVALKDLPAMIDYVLFATNNDQLDYIGHSQGGTAFLALNALKPVYGRKFKSAHLLAGVGYKRHFPSNILRRAARVTDKIYAFARLMGSVEIFGPRPNNRIVCSEENPIMEACTLLTVQDYMGELVRSLEMIGGASIKQYAHYGQNIKAQKFRRWDFGPLRNFIQYGRLSPPEFDLSLINVDITMHYSLNDILLGEQDVLDMARVLPNIKIRKVARESFTHFDYVISTDSRELVTDYIVEKLNQVQ